MSEEKDRKELEEMMRLEGTDSGAELCDAFDAMKNCVLRNNEEIKELKEKVESLEKNNFLGPFCGMEKAAELLGDV